MSMKEETRKGINFSMSKDGGVTFRKNGRTKVLLNPAIASFFIQLPQKLQNGLKSQLSRLGKDKERIISLNPFQRKDKDSSATFGIGLEKQLQAWRENPSWDDQPPEIKVSVPKGSLCNLNVNVDIGLPPDAVYNIVTDPDNRKVFKNITEVLSRKVLVDEGQRQLVEVEQAATWRFLWWSGLISVHVLVDQNREDYSMKFKQMNAGFMKRFEGCWRLEPIFVDEKICLPFKPRSWSDYNSCTGGKGRIASRVTLEQLIQPAIVPPPPISWYARGITAKTAEMMLTDLMAEAARIRGGVGTVITNEYHTPSLGANKEIPVDQIGDIKERWRIRRRNAKQHRQLLAAESQTTR